MTSLKITMATVFLWTTAPVCTAGKSSVQDSMSKPTVKNGNISITAAMLLAQSNCCSPIHGLKRFPLSHSVCGRGQWHCTDEPCPGTCQVYGNGHYQTFDSKWYRFDGHCQYTLVEVRPSWLRDMTWLWLVIFHIYFFFLYSFHFRTTVELEMAPSLLEWRAYPAVMRSWPALAPSSWTYRWVTDSHFSPQRLWAADHASDSPASSHPGFGHPDTERHEGDQTPPKGLDSARRFTLHHTHCGTLHHNLSAQQGDNSHLGQTHQDHYRAAPKLESEWWDVNTVF